MKIRDKIREIFSSNLLFPSPLPLAPLWPSSYPHPVPQLSPFRPPPSPSFLSPFRLQSSPSTVPHTHIAPPIILLPLKCFFPSRAPPQKPLISDNGLICRELPVPGRNCSALSVPSPGARVSVICTSWLDSRVFIHWRRRFTHQLGGNFLSTES